MAANKIFDLNVEVGKRPVCIKNGESFVVEDAPVVTDKYMRKFLSGKLGRLEKNLFEEKGYCAFVFEDHHRIFRGRLYLSEVGDSSPSLKLHKLGEMGEHFDMDSFLGYEGVLESVLADKNIVVTGEAGSGRTVFIREFCEVFGRAVLFVSDCKEILSGEKFVETFVSPDLNLNIYDLVPYINAQPLKSVVIDHPGLTLEMVPKLGAILGSHQLILVLPREASAQPPVGFRVFGMLRDKSDNYKVLSVA